jgi:hypothetical protein
VIQAAKSFFRYRTVFSIAFTSESQLLVCSLNSGFEERWRPLRDLKPRYRCESPKSK